MSGRAGNGDGERLVNVVREMARTTRQSGPCPDDALLVHLADGTLNAEQEKVVQLHLTACRTCASLYDAMTVSDEQGGGLPAEPGPSLLERLADLVSFEMPATLALTTRAATVQHSEAHEAAMEAYQGGRLGEALRGFEEALAAGEDSPALRFYLGACLVDAGRAGDAVEHLRVAADGAPGLAEYRFVLAQALLLTGEGEEAERQLRRTARLPGLFKQRARELAAEVKRALEPGGS